MAGTKEIKNHIKSVKDTQKITNAMYLIASSKLRKAKADLDRTRPYFRALQSEIRGIFRLAPEIESPYFDPPEGKSGRSGSTALLVITADKGLAGAYNQNVLKEALHLRETHADCRLYVVGEYGRQYFTAHQIPFERSFLYTAQNPSIRRAREISALLLDLYERGEIAEILVVYTDFSGGLSSQACTERLLPYARSGFLGAETAVPAAAPFEFIPSMKEVLDHIASSCLTGYLYSALVDSFCSEQNARMTAMDSANQNAQELLSELSVQYNHVRQNAITQEITEVSSGAKALRRNAGKETRPS